MYFAFHEPETHGLFFLVRFRNADVFQSVGNQLIGQYRYRRPESFRKIKGLYGQFHRLLGTVGCQHDRLIIAALGRVTGIIEFTLSRGTRDAAHRPHALGIEYHHRNFTSDGPAIGVGIKNVAGAGCGGHGFHATGRGAHGQVHGRTFIFGLNIIAADFGQFCRHRLGDFGCRGDGIACK